MDNRPVIGSAIPKRRYQVGGFSASLLGEIESGDAQAYRYILAFVPDGQREPVLYVCSQPVPPVERTEGAYRLRVVSELMDEELDRADGWGELESFTEQALKVGRQMLGLQQAPLSRLM